MAKKQTRRSISVRGVTYGQLREHCAGVGLSMSDFIEQRIADYFAEHGIGAPAIAPAPTRSQPAPRLVERGPDKETTAPRIKPVPVAAARPVPAKSSLVSRPLPVAARRATAPVAPSMSPMPTPISAIAPAVAKSPSLSVGRPAPTPAASVFKEQRAKPSAPRDVKDYRAIRF